MKKTNKKGFTLAELLIVIAIIAVLIAIAIPTFSGALENAKRQTDHANIRSAYSVMRVAKMTGGIPLDNGGVDEPKNVTSGALEDTTWTMKKDGTFVKDAAPADAYTTKAAGNATCSECAGCPGGTDGSGHTSGKKIQIKYTATTAKWEIVLA